MTRRLAFALACSAGFVLVVVACSTFDSSDTGTSANGDAAGAESSTGDVASKDSAIEDAAPETSTDAGLSDATVLFDDFEMGSSCNGWAVENSAMADPDTLTAHGGARSCRVCSPASGAQIVKVIQVGMRTGTAQAAIWTRGDDDAGADAATGGYASVTPYGIDGGQYGFAGNGVPESTAWTKLQVVAPVISNTATLVVIIQPNPGSCILVDDILVTVD